MAIDSLAEQPRRRGLNVLPHRVRRARMEAGLTMAELADGRVSRTAIHLIETGRTRPTEGTLAHIAARTGKSMDYFLGGADSPAPGQAEVARRAAEQLRQASWTLSQLLQDKGLEEPERTAILSLLMSARMGVRMLGAVEAQGQAH